MALARKPALTPARAPAVSVCIANYNGRETLAAAIRSVLAQVAPFEVELLVHDDASPDHDLSGLQAEFPQVDLLLGEPNAGYCISNNRMAAIARGEYILLLNNDAVLHADALASLHARARALRGGAILGLPQFDMASGALIDRGSLLDPFLNPLPNLDPARREVVMVMGACLWIPRPLWQELGGFPEWFETLAEDLYLCGRARLAGHPVEVLASSGFDHWVGRSLGGGKVVEQGLRTTRRRRRLSERNKTYAMLVLYPWPALWRVPLHFLLLIAEGLLLSLVKRDLSLWREIYWNTFACAWRERARILAARGEAQAARRAGTRAFFSTHTFLPHKLRLLLRHGVPTLDA